jgi:hypothetical protein
MFLIGMTIGVLGGCFAPTGGGADGTNPPGEDQANDNRPPSAGNGGGTSGRELTVRLEVSNPTPGVDETVLFRCALVEGDAAGVTFSFQPVDPRLIIDERAGTAVLVVSESDVGSQIGLTCSATDGSKTGEPSSPQVVVPVAVAAGTDMGGGTGP